MLRVSTKEVNAFRNGWYTLFDRKTVEVCMLIYRASVFAPFFTRQTSNLYSISCHTRSSMSAVRDAAASEMRRFNSSMSLGKGGTYTKSLMSPYKKKSQGVRSGYFGATSSKECPPVRIDQSSGLADAHLGVHVRLYENGEVPHLARR
jgi:hypothetical protein